MSTAIEKVYLPSRLRRGRLQASPTWKATHGDMTLYFSRKRDAVAFCEHGCPHHHPTLTFCPECNGRND